MKTSLAYFRVRRLRPTREEVAALREVVAQLPDRGEGVGYGRGRGAQCAVVDAPDRILAEVTGGDLVRWNNLASLALAIRYGFEDAHGRGPLRT